MTLVKAKTEDRKSEPTREALWRKRLSLETKCARQCRVHQTDTSYKNSPKVVVFRALLRATGLYARGERNAQVAALRRETFAFDELPDAFDGFTILQLSDFHFEDRPGFTEMVCELLGKIETDLCVMTGDYRFNNKAPCRCVYTAVEKLLAAVKSKHGVTAILGNNDTSGFVDGFKEMGVRMLVNEGYELQIGDASIWLAGVDDPHEFFCAGLHCALDDVPEGAFTILLAHSPELYAQAAERGIDLYLCGHTHAGQICLPRVGAPYHNARCPRKYTKGRWTHGKLQGYTTAGIGTSTVPMRFNCPPEAVLIELKRTPGNRTGASAARQRA